MPELEDRGSKEAPPTQQIAMVTRLLSICLPPCSQGRYFNDIKGDLICHRKFLLSCFSYCKYFAVLPHKASQLSFPPPHRPEVGYVIVH